MTSEIQPFFTDQKIRDLINNNLIKIKNKMPDSHEPFEKTFINNNLIKIKNKTPDSHEPFEETLIKINISILESMHKFPEDWEECSFNIEKMRESFSVALQKENSPSEDLFIMLYRFALELYLKSDEDMKLMHRLELEMDSYDIFVTNNTKTFTETNKNILKYAKNKMLAEIKSSITENLDFKAQIKAKQILDLIEEKTQNWNNDLKSYEEKVEKLKNTLKKQERAFNFVGLNKGFSDLQRKKEKELEDIKSSLWGHKICIIMIFLAKLRLIYCFVTGATIFNKYINLTPLDFNLMITLPLALLLIVLLYFYKIKLTEFKSVTSQIIQLELRQTLCQFIQSYADYSKDISEKNSDTLKAFEKIIFSNIVANDEKIPSTFDGVEQLSQLIGAVKPK